MGREFNVNFILSPVGWTGATMAGSHLLWPRLVVRTALDGLRRLGNPQGDAAIAAMCEEIADAPACMQKLPLLLLAFREASIEHMGYEEVPDRWLDCLDTAFDIAVRESALSDEAVLCALVEGIARKPDRRFWDSLKPILDDINGCAGLAVWSRSVMDALTELRANMLSAHDRFERHLRVRVRPPRAEFS